MAKLPLNCSSWARSQRKLVPSGLFIGQGMAVGWEIAGIPPCFGPCGVPLSFPQMLLKNGRWREFEDPPAAAQLWRVYLGCTNSYAAAAATFIRRTGDLATGLLHIPLVIDQGRSFGVGMIGFIGSMNCICLACNLHNLL